jgi:hypothetical protein
MNTNNCLCGKRGLVTQRPGGHCWRVIACRSSVMFGDKVGFGSAFFVHHDLLASLLIPALGNYYRKVAIAETGLNEAVIACALERYRLANGKLPAALDALMPQFLDKVPLDVCNGLPLVYKPGNGRDFILYSVGWNGTDDGGITVMKKGNTAGPEPSEGDWVWPEYE